MAATEPETKTVTCSRCPKACEVRPLKDGSPALAPGWLNLAGALYCDVCRKRNFAMRSITLPVWSAEPADGESTKDAWGRMLTALRLSFRQAAQVGTWAMRELAKCDNGDITREKDAAGKTKIKLAKAQPSKHLYKTARDLAPDLDSQSVGSVIQRARKKYAETRWEQRVTLTVGLPKFGFPAPIPIPEKDAGVSFDGEGNLWLSVRISGSRFRLRLARNKDHHRQLAAIRKGLDGEGRFGEVTLTGKSDGGKLSEIRARFAMELPIEKHERKATLHVSTVKDKLWSVLLEGREQGWNLNEDQAKSIVFGHANRVQRLADDDKFERRHPRKKSGGINAVRARVAEKYAARMNDFCHKAGAMLVGFAARNHVGVIEYHETSERFIEAFPWFKLRTMCEQKAVQSGISFVLIEDSGESAAPQTVDLLTAPPALEVEPIPGVRRGMLD